MGDIPVFAISLSTFSARSALRALNVNKNLRPIEKAKGSARLPFASHRGTELFDFFGRLGHFDRLAAVGPVVLLGELFDAARGVHVLHLAGEERVAGGADFDRDVLLGAARGELV